MNYEIMTINFIETIISKGTGDSNAFNLFREIMLEKFKKTLIFITEDKKINAIKEIKYLSGKSYKESKEYVDSLYKILNKE